MAQRIAIFGGTFDPIHSAHVAVACEAVRHFRLDRILLVPASHPPHKCGATAVSYEDRCHMAALACQDEPAFEVSRLEAEERYSYSILTIEKVKRSLGPGDTLFFLIGADAFAEIRTWYRWQDVLGAVEFLVISRPGHDYEIPPGATVHRLETLALGVSSSEIRARLARGETPPELPPAAAAYIREKGLYRAE